MTNAEQDIKIERIDQKVDSFKETVENFIQEMRDRDNRRDADIRELRQKHDALSARQDAVANELRAEIRDGMKHIQNLTIAVIIGIVAIAVAVFAFVWQNSSNNQPQNYQPPAQTQNYSPPQITNNSGGD